MNRPTVPRILWQDAAASIAVKVFVALWGFYAFALVMQLFPWEEARHVGGYAAPNLFPFAIAATVVTLPLIAWRVLRIQRVFGRGTRVAGRVDSIDVTRGTGSLVVTYRAGDRAREARLFIKRTARASSLAVGDEVELVVDARDPNTAYPVPLYLD